MAAVSNLVGLTETNFPRSSNPASLDQLVHTCLDDVYASLREKTTKWVPCTFWHNYNPCNLATDTITQDLPVHGIIIWFQWHKFLTPSFSDLYLIIDHELYIDPLNLDIRVTRGQVLPYRPRDTILSAISLPFGLWMGCQSVQTSAQNWSFKLTKVKDFVSNVMITITLTMPIIIMRWNIWPPELPGHEGVLASACIF
jgi:hypothetical protein